MNPLNPCNPLDSQFWPNADSCRGARREFYDAVLPLMEIKQRHGRSLAEGRDTPLSDLKLKAEALEKLYNRKQFLCKNGNMNACGFVYSYDKFTQLFGQHTELTPQDHDPVTLPLKRLRSGYLAVDLSPESVGLEAILDTGATTFMMSAFAYSSLQTLGRVAPMSRVEGHEVPLVEFQVPTRFIIGSIGYFPNYAAVTQALDFFEGSDTSHRLYAAFGTGFLLKSAFEVNYDTSQITFYQDVPKRIQEGAWTAIPLQLNEDDMNYSLAIKAIVHGTEVLMLVDTGSNSSDITEQCLKRIGDLQTSSALDSIHLSGFGERREMRDVPVQIGPHTTVLNRMAVSGSKNPNSVIYERAGICGTVGTNILSNFNFIIDPATFSIYLTPRETPVYQFRSPGYFPTRGEDGRIVLAQIRPESPAEKAGLRVGDILIEIDSRDAADITILGIMEYSYFERDVLPLTIERDGEKMDILIELE